jgi:hypothetical protein
MRFLAMRVLSEYKTLIVKMGLDMTPAPNYKVLVGIEANFDYLQHNHANVPCHLHDFPFLGMICRGLYINCLFACFE